MEERTTKQEQPAPDSKDAKLKQFYDHFNKQMEYLDKELYATSQLTTGTGVRQSELDRLTQEISTLQDEVYDASAFTPDHDQASYAHQLRVFKTKLQDTRLAGATKSKFAFKSAKKVNMSKPIAEKGDDDGASAPKGVKTNVPGSPPKESTYDSSDSEYDDLSYKHLLGNITAHTNVLTDMNHSIIDMRHPTVCGHGNPASVPAFTIRHVKGSLIVLPEVLGATHVTGARNCVLVVETGQLRLHACRDVDVYLKCKGRPIIEDCAGIRVAPLPERYAYRRPPLSPPTGTPTPPPPPTAAELENKWDQVDDFNWLKQSPSPNWRVLREDERVNEDVWRDVVPGTEKIGLTDILKAVGVRNAERGRSRRGSETCGGDGF